MALMHGGAAASFDYHNFSAEPPAISRPQHDTILGTIGDDSLTGTAGADTMAGGTGNDTLNGGGGNDIIGGGDDNDVLSGQSGNDLVTGGDGNDRVTDLDSGSDILQGNDGDDTLTIRHGATHPHTHDEVDGGAGNDLLTYSDQGDADGTIIGGTGNDTVFLIETHIGPLAMSLGDGSDIVNLNGYAAGLPLFNIIDFSTAADSFVWNDFLDAKLIGWNSVTNPFSDGYLRVIQVGADAQLQIDINGHGSYQALAIFNNIQATTLTAADFEGFNPQVGSTVLDSDVSHTVNGSLYGDNLNGAGGDDKILGLSGNDTLVGGAGDDTIDGGTGIDSMAGGADGDTYLVDSGADSVVEAAGGGADTVFASVNYALGSGQSVELLATTDGTGTAPIKLIGNEIAQMINGNAGDNQLYGLDGNDTMHGFGGHNQMLGGAGDDQLVSNGGTDTMVGGLGNDIYLIDSTTDVVSESAGQGTDKVLASVSYALQAGMSVEALGTTASTFTSPLSLVGNEVAQSLTGNNGANTLNGGGGADTLVGLGGNDSYVVDNAADRVVESLAQGADTVFAAVTYALTAGQSVEVLGTTSVAGTAAIGLTGNSFAQTINGNNGANVIVGGGGGDVLYGYGGDDRVTGGVGRDFIDGGAGNDVIVFSALSQSTGIGRDLVLNQDLTHDKFDFTVTPTAIDATVTDGGLNAVHFDANLAAAVGAEELGAHHAVLFDPEAGDLAIPGHVFLVVDANGVAGYQAGQDYVVELAGATGTLTLADFI